MTYYKQRSSSFKFGLINNFKVKLKESLNFLPDAFQKHLQSLCGFKCVFVWVLWRKTCPLHSAHTVHVSLHHSHNRVYLSIFSPERARMKYLSQLASVLPPQRLCLAPPESTCFLYRSIGRVRCLGLCVTVSRCVQEIRNSEMWREVCLRETVNQIMTHPHGGEGGGRTRMVDNKLSWTALSVYPSICCISVLFCLSMTGGQQLVLQDAGPDSSWTEY